MRRFASAACCLIAIVLAAIAAPRLVASAGQAPPSSPQAPPAASVSFDMVVLDREGRAPDTLGPADVTVSVDGKARRALAVHRISRGPGASSDAAARRSRSRGLTVFAAEPIRSILVVVDQAGLVRGEERSAIAAAQALLDRLGAADRLAVVLLPALSDQMLSLATEQPVARETLAHTAGRISPAVLAKPDAPALPPLSNAPVTDPDRERMVDPVPVAVPAPAVRETEAIPAPGTLSGLAGLLDAIRTVPGRKVVAFFSAGLADPPAAQLNDVAAGAAAARTAIYVFGLPGPRDDVPISLQLGPLEWLAKATGGAFVTPGRNPERAVARVAAELASCFTVEVEGAISDADGKRHALRVDLASRGLVARAPAWLVPTPDAGDVPVSGPEPASNRDAPAPPAAADTRPAPAAERTAVRDPELQVALGTLVDYVEAYERQFSGLVAEEEYRQSSRSRNVRMRSDYLLVKPEKSDEWVSFRDVYEVDGVAVRDRDDRLRRLFLEPDQQIGQQLAAIRADSSRYNIGAVERNVNVPLFLLRFLTAENRPRFRFRLAGQHKSAGVDAWRIEFEERVKPTIITDLNGGDVEAKGWFLVDQLTGAIVESGLKVEENGSTGEIIVSFRHDPALGMWVPAQMTESYRTLLQRSMSGLPRLEPFVEGTAIYSKYRRFQVKIEEKLVIPK